MTVGKAAIEIEGSDIQYSEFLDSLKEKLGRSNLFPKKLALAEEQLRNAVLPWETKEKPKGVGKKRVKE